MATVLERSAPEIGASTCCGSGFLSKIEVLPPFPSPLFEYTATKLSKLIKAKRLTVLFDRAEIAAALIVELGLGHTLKKLLLVDGGLLKAASHCFSHEWLLLDWGSESRVQEFVGLGWIAFHRGGPVFEGGHGAVEISRIGRITK